MPAHLDLAIISEDIYHKHSKLKGDWVRTDYFKNKHNAGYYWGEYKNNKTKERVVAFRGTEPTDWNDLIADIHIVLRKNHHQFTFALREGLTFKDRVTYTGHSLGGALAKYVAASLGYHAVAFNAPGIRGLNNLTHMHRNAKIHNINALFDPVSKYGNSFGTVETFHVGSIPMVPDMVEPVAVGATVLATRGYGAAAVSSYYLVGQHSISNLVIELKSRNNMAAANTPEFTFPRIPLLA